MFRRVLAPIGFRGVILADAALGVAVVAAVAACSSSSSSTPASSASAQAAISKGTCTTTISNQTVGNVFVPAGQTCTLNHVTVKGNIDDYGTLQLTTSAAIGGNVVAEPDSIFIESGPTTVTVDGNLTLDGAANYDLTLDHVLGNVTVEEVMNATWTDSTVGGSIFLYADGGGVIGGNTVGHNITCINNTQDPTNGGHPNTVHGHETDQCAGLS